MLHAVPLLDSALPASLQKVAQIFEQSQRQCWIVGGAIRDSFLKKKVEDYDLATDAPPEEVMKIFPRSRPTGIKHGTVTILFRGHHFETTTFRLDGKYRDGRRPSKVQYADNIMDDLSRRDFSINAMAFNIVSGEFIDPHGGRKDMEARLIRAIGSPQQRFQEDSLRAIRAGRFAAQLNFTLERETKQAIPTVLHMIKQLSVERIWQEISRILGFKNPSIAFGIFLDTGLLEKILPEMENCRHVIYKGESLINVMFKRCDLITPTMPRLRMAALLQNLALAKNNNGSNEKIASKVLKRLKAPRNDERYISEIIRSQAIDTENEWSNQRVRHFLSHHGPENANAVLKLLLADAECTGDTNKKMHLLSLKEKMWEQTKQPLTLNDLAVDGSDLMNVLGIASGRELGQLLRHLLDRVLEKPESNKKPHLIEIARKWLETNKKRRD